jgi:hypothetical protein
MAADQEYISWWSSKLAVCSVNSQTLQPISCEDYDPRDWKECEWSLGFEGEGELHPASYSQLLSVSALHAVRHLASRCARSGNRHRCLANQQQYVNSSSTSDTAMRGLSSQYQQQQHQQIQHRVLGSVC